jgi:hypothetical protein
MRSSSIKSFAATLTVVAVVSTATAVTLEARQVRNSQDTAVSVRDREDSFDRAKSAVRRTLSRIFGPVANMLPTIPIPGPSQQTTGTGTAAGTTTAP